MNAQEIPLTIFVVSVGAVSRDGSWVSFVIAIALSVASIATFTDAKTNVIMVTLHYIYMVISYHSIQYLNKLISKMHRHMPRQVRGIYIPRRERGRAFRASLANASECSMWTIAL